MGYTCCVTGHRNIPADKEAYVEQALRREIALAIEDGYTRFISGFAEGSDLLFARIVAEEKQKNGQIKLEAAIPYRNRINSPNALFKEMIGQCDVIGVHSEAYHPGCYMKRNRFMAEQSQRVIAIYDGRKGGGTYSTMLYAETLARDIRLIRI